MTRDEFIEYVERNQKALRRFLTALCCGDSDLADDLAQDALVKAYLSSDAFTDNDKFKAWVFRIAYTTFLTNRRARKITQPLDESIDLADDVEEPRQISDSQLNSALERLPAKERTVVLLHYMQGYATDEIAEITEATPVAVRQQLSRGRQHLKKLLTEK